MDKDDDDGDESGCEDEDDGMMMMRVMEVLGLLDTVAATKLSVTIFRQEERNGLGTGSEDETVIHAYIDML